MPRKALKMMMQNYTNNTERFSKAVWVKQKDHKYHMNPILVLNYVRVHTNT